MTEETIPCPFVGGDQVKYSERKLKSHLPAHKRPSPEVIQGLNSWRGRVVSVANVNYPWIIGVMEPDAQLRYYLSYMLEPEKVNA